MTPPHALLLLTLDFPPGVGGIQAYLEGVAQALSTSGNLLVIAPCQPGDSPSAYPVRQVRWPARGLWKLFAPLLWAMAGFRHLLSSEHRTVIVGHPHLAPAGWLLARLTRARWVQLAYGMEATDGRMARLVRRFWRHPERVVTISQATSERLVAHGAPRNRIVLLPPWIDLPDAEPQPGDPALLAEFVAEHGDVVLCVGRMASNERYKGHDTLLTAWQAIAAERPESRLMLVGGGDDRPRLEALTEQLGVSERVVFTGSVRPEVRDALYRRCQLVVLLSRELKTRTGVRFEGFGIVLLEAGGFCRPVIGGASGGIPDAIEQDVTGLLVDPEDPEALAVVICGLLDDPSRMQQLGQAGRQRVERAFLFDAQRIRDALLGS